MQIDCWYTEHPDISLSGANECAAKCECEGALNVKLIEKYRNSHCVYINK